MTDTRLEPHETPALKSGRCNHCGIETEKGRYGIRKKYCSPKCSRQYNNLLAKQGKSIAQMAKVWRKYRGRKGTPAEGLFAEMCTRLDAVLAQDRERWAEAKTTADAAAKTATGGN